MNSIKVGFCGRGLIVEVQILKEGNGCITLTMQSLIDADTVKFRFESYALDLVTGLRFDRFESIRTESTSMRN